MTRIHIDLETRSTADLRKVGVFVYAADPTTDVWCACWAVDDGPVEVWLPGEPCPAAIVAGALGEAVFVAHNAGFERTLWAGVLEPRHGWPAVPALERWDCTAARAAAMALPRSLDGAAEALGLPVRKDEEGGRLMLRMARPRSVEPDGTAVWWTDKARLDRLIAYCRRDVEVEHALDKALRPLGAHEREIWLLDQRINERGIAVDLEFVARSGEVVEQAKVAAGRELRRITEGAVPSCTARPQMVAWLAKQGVPVDSIDKAALAGLVVREDLDDRVLEALVLWAETAKTSTAKLPTLAKRTSKDGRLRGGLLYHGASTGRWAGIGFQPQNLPRSILKQTDIEWAIAEMRAGATASTVGAMLGPPLSVVSDCIRGCIVAGKGKSLVVADFKSIEGRILAWIAGEKWVLDAYRRGEDLYCLAAEAIYGRKIDPKKDKAERQIGKIAELSCLAESELVLTDRGLVPIEKVSLAHKLWDGEEWVGHNGVVAKGAKEVLYHDGLRATADHFVWVEGQGEPIPFGVAAASGKRLLRSSDGREPIRVGDDHLTRETVQRKEPQLRSRALHRVRKGIMAAARQLEGWNISRMWSVFPTGVNALVAVPAGAQHEAALHRFGERQLEKLWRSWNRISVRFRSRSGVVDSRESRIGKGEGYRSYRQRWELRSRKSSIQYTFSKYVELTTSAGKRKTNTYDILDAGPRNRFTVSGVLVHNCGFGGGKGAFAKMASSFGVSVTPERADSIKESWRASRPATVRFWWDMSRAAMGAVESPGAITTVGKLRFRVKGGFLWMILPNGRPLAYCKPRIEDAEMPWGELRPVVTFMGTNSLTKQWQRQVLSPMVLAENPVQAVARDLMAEAMLRVEAAGYPVVMTVHDEIVCERESKVCDFGEFERIMVTSPAWAAGCPIEVEGWVGSRYRK